jgi:ribosomal protein L3 glutamine methyltransferase
MAKLSHKPARRPARQPSRQPSRTPTRPSAPPTVADALYRGARRLARAGVFFGHGTDNAGDEAAALLWSTLGLSWPITEAALRRPLRPAQLLRYEALLERRIKTRLPSAYLTGETFFAGLPMRVDPRALVPRSPLAELIERQFRPWIDPARVRHILDLCTGGGCIALACAHHLPWARVEGADVSPEALALARENRRRLGLAPRAPDGIRPFLGPRGASVRYHRVESPLRRGRRDALVAPGVRA